MTCQPVTIVHNQNSKSNRPENRFLRGGGGYHLRQSVHQTQKFYLTFYQKIWKVLLKNQTAIKCTNHSRLSIIYYDEDIMKMDGLGAKKFGNHV